MKPKNKFQKLILSLSKKLSPITEEQESWAFSHCFEHSAVRSVKGVCTCLECGHVWNSKDEKEKCNCPQCGTALKITDTRMRIFRQKEHFCIVTTCNGFQVLRFFFIEANYVKGKSADYICREVVQRWIREDGKFETLAMLRGSFFNYNETWDFHSCLEIRPNNNAYSIVPTAIYPRHKTIPTIKRNGFNGKFYDLNPFMLFRSILTDSHAETVLKAGQIEIFQYFMIRSYKIDKYWPAIKICMRNNYNIADATLWMDYIDLLIHFNKDINNPQFVCPANLHEAHNFWMQKKRKAKEKENREYQRELEIQRIEKIRRRNMTVEEKQAEYEQLKSQFFHIEFSDEFLKVIVLSNVKDFEEEGKILDHCVYENEYFLKPDSLILSARIAEQRIETIEISLEEMDIIQCRGYDNQDSEYHHRIIDLVKKNIHLIRKANRKAAA